MLRPLTGVACLLAIAGCSRSNAVLENVGDAIRTTDGVLAASNLDALIEARETFVARNPSRAAERAVLVDLLQTRAQLFGRLEDYDRAEALARAGVELAPASPDAWLARASNRIALHRFADGLQDLAEARRRGVESDAAEALSASALLAQGRTTDALPLRRHAVERWRNTGNLSALAVAELAAADINAALAHLDAAAFAYRDVAPFPLVFIDLQRGLIAEERGELDQAANRYRVALRRLPGHVQAAVHLAAIELARGHAAAAADLLAPLASSGDPEVLALRADVLEAQGARAEAEQVRAATAERYRALVARHPEAFADHAARFLVTRDPARALELARLNLTLRATPAAYDLALTAARAAGDGAFRCRVAAEAQELRPLPPRLAVLSAASLAACNGVPTVIAGPAGR